MAVRLLVTQKYSFVSGNLTYYFSVALRLSFHPGFHRDFDYVVRLRNTRRRCHAYGT